jgi:hypothetical protein
VERHISPLTYDVDHSDVLPFIDGEGHERYVIFVLPDTQVRALPANMERVPQRFGRTHEAQIWTARQSLSALIVAHRHPDPTLLLTQRFGPAKDDSPATGALHTPTGENERSR